MVSIKFLLILLPSVVAHLNVFISQPEVMKLLGLNAELYYVRDGVVNTYAMNFIVPVPAHISDLEFSWQSLTKQPLPYVMSVLYDSQGALLPPQVNISERGVVPITVQTFRVRLPCSGVRSAEVEVRLQLNITAVNRMHEDTWLNFKRNKICLKDLSSQLSPNEESVPRAGPARAGAGAGAGGALYAATACAVGMLAILVTAAAASALYFRTKKSRNNDSIHTSYTTAAYGSHGNVFIRLDALGRPASAGSGSYATIASIHKFPLGSRRSPSPYATTQLSGSAGGGGGGCGGGGGRGHIYARPEPPAYFPPTSSYCASDNLTCVSQVSWCTDGAERLRRLAVPRSAISLSEGEGQGEALQEGTFGRLLRGELRLTAGADHDHKEVLVKTVSEAASGAQAALMVREAGLLAGLAHHNLLSPLAAFLPDSLSQLPLIAYPLLSLGNLKRFLLERRASPGGAPPPLAARLVSLAAGAARGLVFLHARGLAHRDVAARNCAVDEHLQVKVMDTALARDLFPADYHCLGDNENRPVKWMALETLQHGHFSRASDVWSFGVLLWELVTLAQEPYAEVDPFEVAAFLRDGYRLAQPANCPDELYTVMSCCWLATVDARPTLLQLLAFLQDFQAALAEYI